MKIRPVGAEMFQADGRTVMTILIAVFCNFAKASKNCIVFTCFIKTSQHKIQKSVSRGSGVISRVQKDGRIDGVHLTGVPQRCLNVLPHQYLQ